MEARLAGIRRALLARYEVLTPEQQARAKELLQKQ
jgi:Spy/CpxP family protein refolding chaperone